MQTNTNPDSTRIAFAGTGPTRKSHAGAAPAKNVMGLVGLATLFTLSLGGCLDRGSPAIRANAQTISFGATPALTLPGNATVSATASSGLAVSYSSSTPTVCSVNGNTGVVTALTTGTCIIAADQPGNNDYAPATQVPQNIPVLINPNQTIGFGAAPALTLYGNATVSATASSNLAVGYSSSTPTICTVDNGSGVVTSIAAGTCVIAADQAGNNYYYAAPQVTQSIAVAAWAGAVTPPAAPGGIKAALGNTPNTVTVSFIGPASSGGSPVTGYQVISTPAGITATGTASPITVTCPSGCTGYAFSVIASNGIGNSAASTLADVLTGYNVTATFYEPDTQPNNSIFTGSFTLNTTTGTITNLKGRLSESMITPMSWVPLSYQLSAVSDGQGGILATTFALNTRNTFATNAGGNGWAPGSGSGLYYGYPSATAHPSLGGTGNAYAMIYINLANPLAAITAAQLDKIAYADCTAGGMMGDVCMTGTSVAGYGTIGTMSGYPIAQTITKQ